MSARHGGRVDAVMAVAMVVSLVLLVLLATSVISYDSLFLPIVIGVPVSLCGLVGLYFVESAVAGAPRRLALIVVRAFAVLALGAVVAGPWLVRLTEQAVVDELRADYPGTVPAMREAREELAVSERDLADLHARRESAHADAERARDAYDSAYLDVTRGTSGTRRERTETADRCRAESQAAQARLDELDAAYRSADDRVRDERLETARLESTLRSASRREMDVGAGGELSALGRVVSWPIATLAMIGTLVPGLLVNLFVRLLRRR